jgi:hypothetical protein
LLLLFFAREKGLPEFLDKIPLVVAAFAVALASLRQKHRRVSPDFADLMRPAMPATALRISGLESAFQRAFFGLFTAISMKFIPATKK